MKTYNTLIAIVTFSLFSFLFPTVAQNNIGQIWQCNTSQSTNYDARKADVKSLNLVATSDTTTFKLINVFIHVVRRDDGSGGLTQLQIDNWMNLFYNDYVGHHIIIHIIGQSNLNNSTYYNGLTDPNYLPMISTDAHGNPVFMDV